MVGQQNWGGGNFCGTNANGLEPKPQTCLVPYNSTAYQLQPGHAGVVPPAFGLTNGTQYMNGTCFQPTIKPLCGTKGYVQLPFGAPEYVGLGFLVFVTLVVIEVFGSPFMRNAGEV